MIPKSTENHFFFIKTTQNKKPNIKVIECVCNSDRKHNYFFILSNTTYLSAASPRKGCLADGASSQVHQRILVWLIWNISLGDSEAEFAFIKRGFWEFILLIRRFDWMKRHTKNVYNIVLCLCLMCNSCFNIEINYVPLYHLSELTLFACR